MKKATAVMALLALTLSCKEEGKKEITEAEAVSKTVDSEDAAVWTPLFNGKDFTGWHEYGRNGVSAHWKVEGEALVFHPPEDREDNAHYNLITDGEYTNFELSLDWRIAPGGNSGIFWGVKETPDIGQPYASGPEIQVLDNAAHPDAKNGPNRHAGALYDMVPPNKDVTKPAGEWNTTVIRVDHNKNQGTVMMNGEKIAEFAVNGPEWDAMVANSKFNGWDHFGKYPTGKIGLQDHGDVVAYRNIKIKEL
ncbi:DUF1080 domain-containing protein [Maribacter sp. 2307ULW6-5]|uniref:3-keto-disaccharide hydrolase n=1 Tax=Maribacter sp. 2307ULW6-5 TaxID=3386275 RepID=UPI0039BD0B41